MTATDQRSSQLHILARRGPSTYGSPQPTPTSSQRNFLDGRAGNGWARLLRCGRDRSDGGFPNAGYQPASVMRRLSLNHSEPAKKSSQNIPKNRCRTTIARRIVETLAELRLYRGSGPRRADSACWSSRGALTLLCIWL